MPVVDGKKYPYDASGLKAAKVAKVKKAVKAKKKKGSK